MKEAPNSDNRHVLLNVMNNENKEEFLMGSLFCTFELIEKSIYYGSDYPKSSFKQVWVILQVYSISVG